MTVGECGANVVEYEVVEGVECEGLSVTTVSVRTFTHSTSSMSDSGQCRGIIQRNYFPFTCVDQSRLYAISAISS